MSDKLARIQRHSTLRRGNGRGIPRNGNSGDRETYPFAPIRSDARTARVPAGGRKEEWRQRVSEWTSKHPWTLSYIALVATVALILQVVEMI